MADERLGDLLRYKNEAYTLQTRLYDLMDVMEMGGMHGTVALVGVRSAIADLNNTITDLTQRIHAI